MVVGSGSFHLHSLNLRMLEAVRHKEEGEQALPLWVVPLQGGLYLVFPFQMLALTYLYVLFVYVCVNGCEGEH